MSQITPAPYLTMPEPLQKIFLVAAALAVAGFFIYSVMLSKKLHSSIPMLLVVAGFCAIPMETIVTYLGHAVHPQVGNIALFSAVDRIIPWHIALGYTVGFGLLYLLLWLRFIAGKITPLYIYTSCVITVLSYQVFETAGVSTGLWAYYDPQPVWLLHFTAPLTWSFLNAASMVWPAALIIFLLPYLTGVKRVLIPVLSPVGAYMGHMGAGWPMYNIMNSGASPLVMQLSGVAAILLAVFIWWLAVLLIMVRLPDVADARDSFL